MTNLVMSWAINHQQFFVGLASGWAVAHVPLLVGMVFHQAMRIPAVRGWIVANPAKAKAMILEIEKELEKDIDEEAKAAAPVAPVQTGQ